MEFTRTELTNLKLIFLTLFRLTKWSFFVHSTTCNAPDILPRLDLILELCWTFPIAPEEPKDSVPSGKGILIRSSSSFLLRYLQANVLYILILVYHSRFNKKYVRQWHSSRYAVTHMRNQNSNI